MVSNITDVVAEQQQQQPQQQQQQYPSKAIKSTGSNINSIKTTKSVKSTTTVPTSPTSPSHKQSAIIVDARGVKNELPLPPPPGTNKGVSVVSSCSDSDENKSLLARINWLHLYLIVGLPLIVLAATFFVPFRFPTMILAIITYNAFGMGITMGYHRLLSHRSFDAAPIVHFILLLLGAGAFQGSARWWCRNHRAHHRYVDTDKDPYNAKRGIFYSHVGWMLVKQNPNSIGRVDISDLSAPLLRWQHDNYLLIASIVSFAIPTLIAGLWGDFLGGFFYASIGRLVALHHATFCINSLAHFVGSQDFSADHTAVDSYFTALLTFGEGYHNFHHTFASDYRNGIRFYHWDPSKWLTWLLSYTGLTYNINAFPENLIQKTIYQLKEHTIHQKLAKIEEDLVKEKMQKGFKYPLEEITLEEMKRRVTEKNEKLVAVEGKVINVEKWANIHPGGISIINTFLGKDASSSFNGGIHGHSLTAHNLLDTLTVALLKKESD